MQFHDIRTYNGGHGMPAGETIGEQIVAWSFLNINPNIVYHPDYGVYKVVWFRVYSSNGQPAFACVPEGAIKLVNDRGETVPHTLPVAGWQAAFNGGWDWKQEIGTAADLMARLEEVRGDRGTLAASAEAVNAVLGKAPGADWAAHCYFNEGPEALTQALEEYVRLNAAGL